MTKQVKKIYRFLTWLLTVVIAAGTLAGCWKSKYGPPPPASTKYGPPSAIHHDNRTKGNVV